MFRLLHLFARSLLYQVTVEVRSFLYFHEQALRALPVPLIFSKDKYGGYSMLLTRKIYSINISRLYDVIDIIIRIFFIKLSVSEVEYLCRFPKHEIFHWQLEYRQCNIAFDCSIKTRFKWLLQTTILFMQQIN